MADETNTSSWKFWQRKAPSDGFPLADFGDLCELTPIRYARAMYSAGHGLAPWTPMTPPSTQSWPRNGVTLGDVGYLDNNQGSFAHLFNIFHDQKGEPDAMIPDNFIRIEPPFEQWEVRSTEAFFPKGAVITSEGVEATRTSEDTLNITFSCPVQEGGILVLPKGGSREELVVTDALYDYVASQALEWFQFVDGYNKDRKSITIPNGNLYLVTGVDKVPEWSVLSFWRLKEHEDSDEPLSVTYTYGGIDPWNDPKSEFHDISHNHGREELHNGLLAAAFVRGLRIAISPKAWEEYLPTDIYDSVYNVPSFHGKDPSTVTPASFVRSLRKIYPERVKEVVFHPSFVIIEMMLLKIPKKSWPRLIVVDDALWCPLVQGRYINWTVTVDLVAHIFKMNKIMHREGVMYLAPKGASTSISQAETILHRILSYLSEDIQRRAEVYLTTRAIKQAVKLVVFEQKEDD